MFIESFVESGGPHPDQRRWATLTSFTLQAAALGTLLALPLFFTGALPLIHGSQRTIWPALAGRASVGRITSLVKVPTGMARTELQQPTFIPTGVHLPERLTSSTDAASADRTGADEGGGLSVYSIGTGGEGGISAVLAPRNVRLLAAPSVPEKRLVISHLAEGLLLRRVDPEYPRLAKLARIQGRVLLTAVINTHGEVEQLRVVEGHPFLARAAVDAVSQWRYRPYMLNGQACEVETQITVNFRLGD